MTRSGRFLSGLFYGYIAIGVNILYTLGSIPIALHYLSKEEFGLWALITQVTAYLMLLEFGLSASVARFLADHKDDINGGGYGNVIRTGHWIFSAQGLIITIIACSLSAPLSSFLHIPEYLRSEFILLFSLQSAFAALHLSTRTHGSLLWSHQRHDLINIASSSSLILGFAALWLGFHLGWGINSLLLSSFTSLVVSLGFTITANVRLGYYPVKGRRGRFDRNTFKSLFHFGTGLFVINIGNQLASASQVVIVGRVLGLESASTWSIATKAASLAQTLTSRVFDSSAPSLTEMHVRGEQDRFQLRFRDIVQISAFIGLAAMGGIVLLNEPLLEIWTAAKISWDPANDILLGLFVLITTLTRCFVGVAIIERRIQSIKFASLAEGLIFIGAAFITTRHFGYPGLLVVAIVCNLLFSGFYAIQYVHRTIGLDCSVRPRKIMGTAIVLAVIAGLFHLFHLLGIHRSSVTLHLLAGGCALVTIVLPLLWMLILDRRSRNEILSRVLGFLRRQPT